MRCREWVANGWRLDSHHQWEHMAGGPTHCTLCGAEYAEFNARAMYLEDMYLEVSSE